MYVCIYNCLCDISQFLHAYKKVQQGITCVHARQIIMDYTFGCDIVDIHIYVIMCFYFLFLPFVVLYLDLVPFGSYMYVVFIKIQNLDTLQYRAWPVGSCLIQLLNSLYQTFNATVAHYHVVRRIANIF